MASTKFLSNLVIDGSGGTVLDVQGSVGQLFSVTDSLTGDLFAVSDISGIPILNVNSSGAVDIDGTLNLGDSDKIQLGASQDLQIYHNGNDSYIQDSGTGDLRIISSATKIYDADSSHFQATFTDGGSVDLYYGGNKKLETTSTGVTVTGNIGATNFSGSSSGTNTGDQTLPTASSLGAVTLTGTQTISGAKTFSSSQNHYKGHLYYDSYDSAGNHYFHFNDGAAVGGTTVNWRQYYGTQLKTHTWTSDSSGNMTFTFQGDIDANGGDITADNFSGSSSGTNTGDQDLSGYSTASGVEDNADVTDATNVAAAGALMKAGGTMTGNLTVSSGTNGDSKIIIESDTDNSNENDNPQLHFKQDGGLVNAYAGLVGDEGNIFTDSATNAAYFGVTNDVPLQLFTNSTSRLTINGNGTINLEAYGAGILKTDANGLISLDTNTYSTATGVEDNADVTDATNVAAAGALMKAGGTMTGAIAMADNNISGVGNLSVNAGNLSITGDGSDVVTLTQSGSGDFTIDAPDDIRLDAGGGDVVLKADSTEYGRFGNYSGNLGIRNITEDKDIIFKGNDGGTTIDALTLDMSAGGDATFAGAVTTGGKLYIGTTSATTTAVTALLLGAAGEVKKRGLGSNAFSSTSFLPLAGGTVTGQVIFPSASTTKPVLPNGYIARNDNADTDGTHDIWGISERYYPSNSTDADAWGIQWSGTPNEINFIGAGQKKLSIDLDTAGTVKIDGNAVATESYVGTAISNLVDSSPAALDTLNELAAALGDDASFSTTMSTALGNRLRIDVNNQSLSSTELANARTNLGLGTAATSASTDFVAVGGDTMTGTLRLPKIWSSSSLSTNSFYVQDSNDGFAFGVGTSLSTWFSWDNVAGQKRAIDVWNDGSKILLGAGGHDTEISNDLYVPNHIFHTGDTDTYMQFHAADQWRVVTGGTERLEVNSTQVSISNNLVVTGTVSGSNFSGSSSGTNTGDQTLPTDFVSKANGGDFAAPITISGGGNTLTLKKGTGNAALTFGGASATPEASGLIEGIAGGGLKFYTSTSTAGTIADPGWSPKLTIAQNGAATFTNTIAATNFSGSSSGTNTGDQTLPTLSSLGALSTSAAASTYLPLAGGTLAGNVAFDAGYTLSVDTTITDEIRVGNRVTLTESTDRADLLYINSSTSGWGGLQIGNTSNEFIFSLMGNGSIGGIYDDQNADWLIQWTENAGVSLYFENSDRKLQTISTGVAITGDIKIDSALLSNQENTDVDTGTETVATVAHATYTAAFFDYVIKNGTNVRAGTVYSCHDGTNVEFTETSTVDLGDTSDVTLAVDISGTDMRLRATTTSNDWSIKSLVRAI